MKKSTREVSDLSHICFFPIIEHFFFFIFEHYSLPYNDFLVSGSKHTAHTFLGNIENDSNNSDRVTEERIVFCFVFWIFFCIYTNAIL